MIRENSFNSASGTATVQPGPEGEADRCHRLGERGQRPRQEPPKERVGSHLQK